MKDFTINVTKGEGRAVLKSETHEATLWMQENGLTCVPVDKDRALSYVDQTLVEALRAVLCAEGFFVEVCLI